MNLALIDYGAGNMASVLGALAAAGQPARRCTLPVDIADATALVLPGVGHFGATRVLDDAWRVAIRTRLDTGAVVLGLCLGMQWLFEGSEEAPGVRGFGAFAGQCVRLRGSVKVPHVGWNSLESRHPRTRLLANVPVTASAYFTHTFVAPITPDTVATTSHGVAFASVVESGRVFGVQCHPEKSGGTGLTILSNFLTIARGERC